MLGHTKRHRIEDIPRRRAETHEEIDTPMPFDEAMIKAALAINIPKTVMMGTSKFSISIYSSKTSLQPIL